MIPILADGQCVAHLLIGQYLSAKPRGKLLVHLCSQAERYGMARLDYTAVLEHLPVLSTVQVQRHLTDMARVFLPNEAAPPRARQASHSAKDRFARTLLNSIQAAVVVYDADMRIVMSNAAARELMGLSTRRIRGKKAADQTCRFMKNDASPMSVDENPVSRVLKTKQALHGQELGIMRPGRQEIIWALVGAEPLYGSRGEVERIIVTFTDITERRRHEEDLRQASLAWSATFDAMHDAVALIDPDGGILKCNRAMQTLIGKTLPEILGRPCYELLHGSKTPIPDCPHVRARKTGRRASLDLKIGAHTYHVTVDPICDSEGRMSAGVHIISDITARKEVEDALRLSEEKFRLIFENALEGIFQATPAGRYLSVNPATARMFGYSTPLEMITMVKDIGRQLYVNPQDRTRLLSMLKKWERVDGYEVEVFRKDKSRFWISINSHTVKDANGQILYYEGTYIDITARTQAEFALRESEARFRSLIQNSGDLIVILDKNGLISYETPSIERILGYPQGLLLGRSPMDFIHPQDLPQTMNDLHDVYFRREEGTPSEFRFVKADGTWAYLEAIGKNMLDYPGINGVVITARDISERKHAEDEIAKASQRYRDLVESTNEFFWEVNPEWSFTYVSPKAHDYLGYDAHELLGKPALDFMSRGEVKRVWNAVRKELEHGQGVNNFEHTILQTNGRTIILESSILPVMGGGHAISGYRGVSRDITERKRLEDELAKVQKLDSIGTLAGGIAHDYNNLLTAILGYIGLCKTSIPKADPAFELIEKAEKAALSARDLTKQLITFSRGGMPLRKVTHIRVLIEETVKFSLSGSKLKPHYTTEGDIHPVFIDEDQMRQVIQNLVINAREAMQDNGELDIELADTQLEANNASSLPAGEYIRILIRDYGRGIPPELLPKVFDPYFSTKELGSQKGMGLGLSICYSIVKKHGGNIRLDSTVGVGTTASVFLPAAKP